MLRAIISLAIVMLLGLPWFAKAEQLPKFISLSDIHFDPFVGCKNEPLPCARLEKLRNAPYQEWEGLLENNSNSIVYHQDTSYPLLATTLLELEQIKKQYHPQFVMILGDFLAHDFRKNYKYYSGDSTSEGYKAFVKKTLQFLTFEITKVFPDIDVYPAIGNNDSYQDDYVVSPGGKFLRDTAMTWSSFIKNKRNQQTFRTVFPIGGYYVITVPQTNNKIIVLDTVLFSDKIKATATNQAAAQAELAWLKAQLQSAAEHHQPVFLACHIPVGIDVFATLKTFTFIHEFWRSDYAREFEGILNEYSATVSGILAGHIHMDTFQLVAMKQQGQVPVIFTSSISPVFGNNPGFKVFSYLPKTFQIKNYNTYYYPLNDLRWQKEYSFNRTYQRGCHHCLFVNGVKQLMSDKNLLVDYEKYYAASHNSQPITEEPRSFPYYWCNLTEITPSSYRACLMA